jgi:type II secretory pathway component PulF
MSHDEFAFFNQQLAAMLRDGIPLEGALRRLCGEMRRGPLRDELQRLQDDLTRGTPLADALAARQLPELYVRMTQVGVKSGDLPGALTLLADYFQRQNNLWTRLKGLMVYPLIVLFAAFALSGLLAVIWFQAVRPGWHELIFGLMEGSRLPAFTRLTMPLLENLWVYPTLFGLLFVFAVLALVWPPLRQKVRWRLPAFKEASVARMAASMHLLLKGGVSLPDALALVAQLESGKAAEDLRGWLANLSAGRTKFTEVAAQSRVFPPLFVWLVSSAGEDLAGGFRRAAEIYEARAAYRAELGLYAALPVSVLFLGAIILSQGFVLVSGFLVFVQMLNGIS